MSSEDQDKILTNLLHSSHLDEEFSSMIDSPLFAQKVIRKIERQAKSPLFVLHFLQNKYTQWVLFLGLVLFPALVEANLLRSLCFS